MRSPWPPPAAHPSPSEPLRRHASALALACLGLVACPGFPGSGDTDGTTGDSGGPLTTEGPGVSTSGLSMTSLDPDTATSSVPDPSTTTGEPDPGTSTSTSRGSATSTDTGWTTDGSTDTGWTTGPDTDTDTDTDGDPDPQDGCADDCVAGCQELLLAPMHGQTRLWHTADARLGLDETGRAVLWAAPSDDVIARYDGVAAADLAADTFAVEVLDTATLRSALDASVLGTVDVTGASWGLARDGSYAWVADGTSLRVFELDGTLRWDRPGDYTDAHVLALPTTIHVHAAATGPAVEHVDAATAVVTASAPFLGTFGGWFHDLPRFWTTQGDAYRLYDPDGTQLVLDVGIPRHGYGDWLVLGGSGATVVAITDVSTPVVGIPQAEIYGAGILGDEYIGEAVLVDLSQPLPTPQVVTLPCCGHIGTAWSFAFADGHWMISGGEGEVYDEQGDPLATGEIEYVHGAASGRLGTATSIDVTTFWEVSPACALSPVSSIERRSWAGVLSGDGSTFVSAARHPQLSVDLYDVATGTVFDTTIYGLSSSFPAGMQVSDGAELFGLRSINTGISNTYVRARPGWVSWASGSWAHTPAISPNGLLAVRNDAAGAMLGATFEGSLSYVLDAAGLVTVFGGVTHGFVDDTTLLVAHYEFVGGAGGCLDPGECDVLVNVELVDPAGLTIAVSPIPDPRDFQRISSTEVLLPDPPAIYDVYSGALLWSVPAGPAAAVGLDHVVHVVDGDLVLTKWR